MKTALQIGGMMCPSCVGHVTKALENVESVRDVQVQLEPQLAIIEHDGADEKVLITAVEDEGYTAHAIA